MWIHREHRNWLVYWAVNYRTFPQSTLDSPWYITDSSSPDVPVSAALDTLDTPRVELERDGARSLKQSRSEWETNLQHKEVKLEMLNQETNGSESHVLGSVKTLSKYAVKKNSGSQTKPIKNSNRTKHNDD
ncbi:hypothetical protein QJS10_CPB12g00237 [Acorus calamus]|uniref:Uncharacterized protein n=1 Tax=Acorus calamus TaxID=4465 RepID=A0AAV9DQF1_ACOCL|nr:hypothetical protein QJS10_CPB12g00237 [Acorus calamus]